jgi:hypothetical protein
MEAMAADLEYKLERNEAFFSVVGPDAAATMNFLFGRPLQPAQLEYVGWAEGAPQLAACWFPPDRLEIRVTADGGWPQRLVERLRKLAPGSFGARLDALIARVEAWSYADTEVAAGAEDIGAELSALSATAPSTASRRELKAARDALDDGLPAEAVAAALYRARGAA